MIIFQIKLLNETNFFLILIYLLLQLKIVHVFPLKFPLITSIQIALLLVNWPPQCIAIDHTSIGLKRVTIQLVVSEARLSVLMRFSRHNTSQVCTATLNVSSKTVVMPQRVSVHMFKKTIESKIKCHEKLYPTLILVILLICTFQVCKLFNLFIKSEKIIMLSLLGLLTQPKRILWFVTG